MKDTGIRQDKLVNASYKSRTNLSIFYRASYSLNRVNRRIGIPVFLYCIIAALSGYPQSYDSLKHRLVERIEYLQDDTSGKFMPGILPSFITPNKKAGRLKPDNNIYFNAIICYTLNKLAPQLSEEDQLIIRQVSAKSNTLYPHYQNKSGRLTYNFWRTDTTLEFPYSRNTHKITDTSPLPDDLDDTSMILLAMNSPDSIAREVHILMQQYVNSPQKKVRGAAPKYRQLPAYSAWFGKKFPVLFDVCVSANILSFVNEYKLTWTRSDSATMDYIVKVINSKDYIRKPVNVSPYYGRRSIIIYHLARLIAVSDRPQLNALRGELIRETLRELGKTDVFVEKIILHTSLLRLGYNRAELQLPEKKEIIGQAERPTLPFFLGNMPSYLINAIKIPLTFLHLYIFYHHCPAYNDALLLEYLTLKEVPENKKN
jgi:hypothetical protein